MPASGERRASFAPTPAGARDPSLEPPENACCMASRMKASATPGSPQSKSGCGWYWMASCVFRATLGSPVMSATSASDSSSPDEIPPPVTRFPSST